HDRALLLERRGGEHEGADDDRQQQSAAVGDLYELRGDVERTEEVVEEEDADRTECRGQQTATSAGEVAPAERDGGQRQQDVGLKGLGVGGLDEPGEGDPA